MRIILLFCISFVFLLFTPFLQVHFSLPKTSIFCIGIDVLVICDLVKSLMSRRFKIQNLKALKNNRLLQSVVLLVFVCGATTIFSTNFTDSFLGSFHRQNGFWLFFHLIIFSFYIVKLFRDRKNDMIWALIINTSVVSLIGILQYIFDFDISNWMFGLSDKRIVSTVGQTNFLGYLIVFVLPFYFYLFKTQIKYRIFIFVSFIVSFVALIFTLSRGAWIAVIFAINIYFLIWIFKKIHSKLKKIIILSLIIIFQITLLLGFVYFSNFVENDIKNPILRRIVRIVDIQSPTVQSRLIVWKTTKDLFLQNPVLGLGGDTLQNHLSKFVNIDLIEYEKFSKIPDRMHNVFLDILISHGILGLLSYMMFFWYLLYTIVELYNSAKTRQNKLLCGTIFFSLLIYFVELQFGFATILDQIVFWTIVGTILIEKQVFSFVIDDYKKFDRKNLFIKFLTLFVIGVLIFINMSSLYGNYILKQGINNQNVSLISKSIDISPNKGYYIYYALDELQKDFQKFETYNNEQIQKFENESQKLIKDCFQKFGQKSLCYLSEARYLSSLGKAKNNNDYHEKAIDSYNKSLKENPLYILIYLEQALLYLKLDDCFMVEKVLGEYEKFGGEIEFSEICEN